MRHVIAIIILLSLFLTNAYSQQHQYLSDTNPSPQTEVNKASLYVAIDKNIYAKSEMVWFAGYLLSPQDDIQDTATVLLATLVEDITNTIILQKKFPVTKTLCKGNFIIPDTTLPGNYHIVFHTNLIRKNTPALTFKIPITIKSNTQGSYTTQLTIIDSASTASKLAIDVQLIPTIYRQLMPDGYIEYYTKRLKKKKLKLNQLGYGRIFIEREQIDRTSDVLYTTSRYNEETYNRNLKLANEYNSSNPVQIYPEGGHLIYGLLSRVVIEAGAPVTSRNAVLLENGKEQQHILLNEKGVGIFELNPQKNAHYSLQLINQRGEPPYPITGILDDGIVMRIENAVVKDSVQLLIQTNTARKVRLLLNNTFFNSITPLLTIQQTKKIILPLTDINKGVLAITILDEQDRPLAERLIFSHFDKKNHTTLTLNNSSFSTRDSVAVALSIVDENKAATEGLATISCVAMNRIALDKRKDIESFFYLEKEFDNIHPYTKTGRILEDKNLLELLLLLKGWRRYKWMQTAKDTTRTHKTITRGLLLQFGQNIRKEETMIIFKKDGLGYIVSDGKGHFNLSEEDLLVDDGKKLFLKVLGKKKDGFTYEITDSLLILTSNDIKKIAFPNKIQYIPLPLDESVITQMNSQEKGKVLETVVIKSTKSFHAYGANECGDYICQNNVLNCPNHPIPFGQPIVGNYYHSGIPGDKMKVRYNGCQNGPTINTDYLIYRAKDFYGMDRTLMQESTEEMMSTIYWKPFAYINKEGQLRFSFFTSDLKGAYLLVAQGITASGSLIFAQKIIKVE